MRPLVREFALALATGLAGCEAPGNAGSAISPPTASDATKLDAASAVRPDRDAEQGHAVQGLPPTRTVLSTTERMRTQAECLLRAHRTSPDPAGLNIDASSYPAHDRDALLDLCLQGAGL